MSSLNSVYFKLDTLKTLVKTLEKKGENGISITVSINDDGNDYGQNISAFVSQSKEDREAKKPRFYVGNGNTFWTDGSIKVCKKDQQPAEASSDEDDDVPF